jgi:hypothetical protein
MDRYRTFSGVVYFHLFRSCPMISHRRILVALVLGTVAACSSPSDPGPSRAADNDHRSNATESAPPPADTVGRGGNVMGGGH